MKSQHSVATAFFPLSIGAHFLRPHGVLGGSLSCRAAFQQMCERKHHKLLRIVLSALQPTHQRGSFSQSSVALDLSCGSTSLGFSTDKYLIQALLSSEGWRDGCHPALQTGASLGLISP